MENIIVNELKKYVKRYCFIKKIDKQSCDAMTKQICDNFINNNFDFEKNIKFRNATKLNKKRLIAYYEPNSTEYFLTAYIAKVITKQTKLKFANAQKKVNLLLDCISKVKNINDFAIVQFDFKNFYNSLSSEYVYNYFLKKYNFENDDNMLLKNYFKSVLYTFAGLRPSNFIGELILQAFEKQLKQNLQDNNLIDCIRYGDDYIVFFDKVYLAEDIAKIIKLTVNQVFYEKSIYLKHKNKVCVHLFDNKFSYVTKKQLPFDIDYLGYLVTIKNTENQLDYEIDVSPFLKKFFVKDLKETILKNYKNVEKLRMLIKLKTRRLVFRKFSILEGTQIISLNYPQNRNVIIKNLSKISSDGLKFYKNEIKNIFNELNLPVPYYLKNKNENSGYCLYANLIKKRTVLLHPKIGLSKNKILDISKKIGLNTENNDTNLEKKLIYELKNKKKTL